MIEAEHRKASHYFYSDKEMLARDITPESKPGTFIELSDGIYRLVERGESSEGDFVVRKGWWIEEWRDTDCDIVVKQMHDLEVIGDKMNSILITLVNPLGTPPTDTEMKEIVRQWVELREWTVA